MGCRVAGFCTNRLMCDSFKGKHSCVEKMHTFVLISGLITKMWKLLTCFSVITWSLSKKCKTRGNLPIGNLWLAGSSHTYLLWWIMGSPLDSSLTCSQVRYKQAHLLPNHSLKVFRKPLRSYVFSVETSTKPISHKLCQARVFTKNPLQAGHFCLMLNEFPCYIRYENPFRRYESTNVRVPGKWMKIGFVLRCCHLLSRRSTNTQAVMVKYCHLLARD